MTTFIGYRINDDVITGAVAVAIPVPGVKAEAPYPRPLPPETPGLFDAGQDANTWEPVSPRPWTLDGLSFPTAIEQAQAYRFRYQQAYLQFRGGQRGGSVDRSAQPLAIRELRFTAAQQFSFFDDFYNQVYLIPKSFDFGAIASPTTKSIRVWNAFLGPSVLAGLSITGGEGLKIAAPEPPFNLPPLASLTITATASPQGPPNLDAIVTQEYETPDYTAGLDLRLTGIRAKLWSFPPNWREGYQVTRQFKTDLIVSESGKEQRRALRSTPRKTIEFTASLGGNSMIAMQRFLSVWQHRSVFMPIYTRYTRTAGALAANNYVVAVESVPSWLKANIQVVVGDGKRFELRKVQSVSGINITFADASLTTWPTGTNIYQTVSGNLAGDLQASRPTNSVAELKVSFDVEPTSEPADNGATGTIFNGREVLLKKPNWSDAPAVTYSHPSDVVDYGRGKIARYTPILYPTVTKQMTFVGRDLPETESIEQFFCRMKGQRGEFYMPTWDYDLKPKFTAPAGTNSIRVEGLDVVQAFADDTVYQAIAVVYRDGTYQFRTVHKIYSVNDAQGNDSIVQLDTAFTADVNPANISMVCWMPVWRFAADNLTTEWLTNEVAQFKVSVRTLEDREGQ